MKKRNDSKYLILGIIFIGILGCLIYYFINLSEEHNYLDTFNSEDDNKYDEDEIYFDDDLDRSENNNLDSNNNIDNSDTNENIDNNSVDNNSINNDNNYFMKLSVNSFINLINNKNNFILVISQTWCSHCTSYKPKVEEVANNNKINVYYIEYNILSEDDKNTFNSYVDFSGTPTTVFFKNGVEIEDTRIMGDSSINEIENTFRNNGYIK